jgi:hypothetical protein
MNAPLAAYAIRLLAGACLCLGWIGAASAQVIDRYWMVTGIAEGEALNVHEQPSSRGKVLARIPAATAGLPQGPCASINPLSGPSSSWCSVEHGGVRGWVDSRFLAPDPTPRLPTYAPPIAADQARYRGFARNIRKVSAASVRGGAGLPPCRRLPVVDDELVIVCDLFEK